MLEDAKLLHFLPQQCSVRATARDARREHPAHRFLTNKALAVSLRMSAAD